MKHNILTFQISMDNVMLVHFLYKQLITAIPKIICLMMSIDYFSGILPFSVSISDSVPPLQYSIIIIFKSLFS